jgi:hypothetical protein
MGHKWGPRLSSSSSSTSYSLVPSRKAQTPQNCIHSMLMMMMMIMMKTHKAVRHSQQFRHQLHSQDSIKGSNPPHQPSSLLHIKTQPQPQHFFFFFFNQYPFGQHSKHSKHTSTIVINNSTTSRQLIRRLSV